MRRNLTEEQRAAIRAQYPRPVVVKPKAEVVDFPDRLNAQDVIRRQLVIDACWERTLEARRELERGHGRGFHRGFGED
jgi:hypothetical protein